MSQYEEVYEEEYYDEEVIVDEPVDSFEEE
jgi:hypothetical protein